MATKKVPRDWPRKGGAKKGSKGSKGHKGHKGGGKKGGSKKR